MKPRKSTLLVIVISCAAPIVAHGGTGDVIRSLATPGTNPTGLAYDGTNLWVADRLTDLLYAVDPDGGGVVRTLPAPGFVPLGLAWDGEHLWCLDGERKMLHKMDVDSGTTVKSFEAATPSPQGLAWDGEYLWISDGRSDRLSRISTEDGTMVVDFAAPAGAPQGLAFDGRYLWVADRVEDRIFMVDPEEGRVILGFDAPGKYARGLAWVDGSLWNADYQDDRLYALEVDREQTSPKITDRKTERLLLTHEFRNYGPGRVPSLDVYFALAEDLPNQTVAAPPSFEPQPTDYVTDRWGQRCAHFHVDDVPMSQRVRHTMEVTVELATARWFLFPETVGSFEDIPDDISARYLVDEDKYRINDPVIVKAVMEAVGDETHPYWVMRRIHSYVGEKLEYELVGGWNVAPAVLERGNGSCSEYTFVFIAMCRAAGLPARYVGAVMLRGDDASTDEVYHRWPEVYMPGYGWIPADAQAGDKERPADEADSIGFLRNRAFITTTGGGASEYLGWRYNTFERWTSHGPANVHVEAVGEWSPVETP